MRLILSVAAVLMLSACAKREKIPEYSTGGQTYSYMVAWQGSGAAAVRVSLVGACTGGAPSLWTLRRGKGQWRAFLHLSNGSYRYRFAEEYGDGRVRFFHDPRCTVVLDDGWVPGSRDPRTRNCLYITVSGFVASNGKKYPLPGGVPVLGR